LVSERTGLPRRHRGGTRTIMTVAASVVVVAGLLVFAAQLGSDGSDETVVDRIESEPPVSFDLAATLSTRTSLSIDDRVVPSWVPDGYLYQFAFDKPGTRQVTFSNDDGDVLVVSVIGDGGSFPSDTVEIDGRTWRASQDGTTLLYSRGFVGPNVSVTSSALDADTMRRVIESLVVGGPEVMGSTVLDPDGPFVDVATHVDGADKYTLAIQEVNGWACTKMTVIVDGELFGESTACGTQIAIHEGSLDLIGLETQQHPDGTATVAAYGVAAADVAEVTVNYADGASTSATPTAGLTRLWVATYTVDYEPDLLLNGIVESIVATDRDGEILDNIDDLARS